MAPQNFEIGDEVRITYDYYHSGMFTNAIGKIISRHSIETYLVSINAQQIVVREQDLERLNKYNNEYRCEFDEAGTKGVINKPMKLNSMMRRLLNADIKKLIKAGLMNGDLLLTDEGRNALYALLVETHKKELVEIAQEIITEKKEENN